MKHLILKDRRRRVLFSFFEKRRLFLKAIVHDKDLPKSFRVLAYRELLFLPSRKRSKANLKLPRMTSQVWLMTNIGVRVTFILPHKSGSEPVSMLESSFNNIRDPLPLLNLSGQNI